MRRPRRSASHCRNNFAERNRRMTAPLAPALPIATDRSRSRALWLTLAAAFLGWMFDGVEIGIFPLVARPALGEMLGRGGDQLVGVWMGRITAVFLFGAATGGLLFGWLGDRIGRVRAMAFSILVYSAFTGLGYFATQPWHLAVVRFLAALGMGGEWSLGVALVMETWPAKHRPMLAGSIGAAANLGSLLLSGVVYAFPITPQSWRWVMVLGATPAILTFLIRLFVPESERWQQAVAAAPSRPIREIVGGPLLGRTLAAVGIASVALIGTWGSVQWIPLWADQLTGGTHPQAKAAAYALISAGAIFGGFAGALGAERIGRRPAFVALCVLSLGTCTWLFRGIGAYGGAFLALSFAIGAFTAAFYGWMPLYLPELFPTRVRATAQGISYNFGRILAGFGALGAGQLVSFYHGDYARMGATITLVYLVGVGLIWAAPETKGKPLPE
jgi:SHS family sialic acid transporter-like MFS transporter